jgi:sulfoxide reductase heme-binding subunit YedZ
MSIHGPTIAYLFTLIVALIGGYSFADGINLEANLAFLHYTGRLAFLLLVLVLSISTLNTLLKQQWTRYVMKNRRYFGISFAVVMAIHFLAVLALEYIHVAWFEENITQLIYALGISGVIAATLLGVTSNNLSVKQLGAKRWKKLHLVGGYWLLTLFLIDYLLIQTVEGGYWQFGILGVALLIIRLRKQYFVNWMKNRSTANRVVDST